MGIPNRLEILRPGFERTYLGGLIASSAPGTKRRGTRAVGQKREKPRWVVSKNRGGLPPKMNGENNGKPYFLMDDLGVPLFSNILYFHPEIWGNDPILTSIFFSKGLVQPPGRFAHAAQLENCQSRNLGSP